MVSYTPEWLQTDDMINTLTGKRRHLSGNQPAFTELRVQRYNLLGFFCFLVNIFKRLKVQEGFSYLVDFINLFLNFSIKPVDSEIRNIFLFYMTILVTFILTKLCMKKSVINGGTTSIPLSMSHVVISFCAKGLNFRKISPTTPTLGHDFC